MPQCMLVPGYQFVLPVWRIVLVPRSKEARSRKSGYLLQDRRNSVPLRSHDVVGWGDKERATAILQRPGRA